MHIQPSQLKVSRRVKAQTHQMPAWACGTMVVVNTRSGLTHLQAKAKHIRCPGPGAVRAFSNRWRNRVEALGCFVQILKPGPKARKVMNAKMTV